MVTTSTNLWSRLGTCDASGDNLQMVMKKEGVSFRHAVEILERSRGLLRRLQSSGPTRGPTNPSLLNPRRISPMRRCCRM